MDRAPAYVPGMADGGSNSTREVAMRRHTWQRFEEIALLAARHLQLTAWEVNFLLGLAEAGSQTHGEMALSDKQLQVLLRLEDRVKVQQILDLARSHPGRLSAWEEDFLANLAQSHSGLSEKQAHVLLRIEAKVTASTGAGVPVNAERRVRSREESHEAAERR
jgi:hypothetical protein